MLKSANQIKSFTLSAVAFLCLGLSLSAPALAQQTNTTEKPGVCEATKEDGPGGLSCDKKGSAAEENLLREYAGRTCVNNGDANFCMVCNTYFESAFEPYIGKLQVGRTVMERKLMGQWGRSNCSVIWAYKQFSWTFLNQSRRLPVGGRAFQETVRAALASQRQGPNGATHYYNPHIVHPVWANGCHRAPLYSQYSQRQIGQHVFLNCGGPSAYTAALVSPDLMSGDVASIEAEQYMTSGSFMIHDESGEPLRDDSGHIVYEVPEALQNK